MFSVSADSCFRLMPSPPSPPHPLTWCCFGSADVGELWKASGRNEGESAIRGGSCCGWGVADSDESGGGGSGSKPSVAGPEKRPPEGEEFDDEEVPERGKPTSRLRWVTQDATPPGPIFKARFFHDEEDARMKR